MPPPRCARWPSVSARRSCPIAADAVCSTIAIRSLAEPRFSHYTRVRFRVVHVTLDMWAPFRAIGLSRLANRFPEPYEKYLAFRFPTMNIRAEFEVLA